jgi:hypothetical protein
MSSTYISDVIQQKMMTGISTSDYVWLSWVENNYWLTDDEEDLIADLKNEYMQWLQTFGGDQ